MTIGQCGRSKKVKNEVSDFTLEYDRVVLYIQHKQYECYIIDLRGQGQGQIAI